MENDIVLYHYIQSHCCPKYFEDGIWFNFWREITGSLDEAGDEAEASRMHCIKTL